MTSSHVSENVTDLPPFQEPWGAWLEKVKGTSALIAEQWSQATPKWTPGNPPQLVLSFRQKLSLEMIQGQPQSLPNLRAYLRDLPQFQFPFGIRTELIDVPEDQFSQQVSQQQKPALAKPGSSYTEEELLEKEPLLKLLLEGIGGRLLDWKE